MEQNFQMKLHILGVDLKELEECKTRAEQRDLIRRAARKAIKNKKIHPDDPLTDLTEAEATTATRITYEARDEILLAIEYGKIPVDMANKEDIESPFTKMVNEKADKKRMNDFIDKFSNADRPQSVRTTTKKRGLNKVIDNFNNKYFSARDAIDGLKRRVQNKNRNRER